ncbi:MAG: aldehyde dehydrogenase family protein [Planctomycetota bacterium]
MNESPETGPAATGKVQAYQLGEGSTTGAMTPTPIIDASRHRWQARDHRDRCEIISTARFRISEVADDLIAACRTAQRVDDVETVASELIPLCDALAWIGRCGPRTLADRRVGLSGRPIWMWGVRSVVRRRPVGHVLILGAWNYPLLLTGTQMAQALAAGNSVGIKPAVGSEAATRLMLNCFRDAIGQAGGDRDLITEVESSRASAQSAIADRPDLIVLTGSAATGRLVMHQAADVGSDCILELSGADAVLTLRSALTQADCREALLSCLEFGLLFNSGATCIGPRRWFVPQGNEIVSEFANRLANVGPVQVHPAARPSVATAIESALANGAVDVMGQFDRQRLCDDGTMLPVLLDGVESDNPICNTDLFAPVMSVLRYNQIDNAIRQVNTSRYRLAASVFGDVNEAESVAERLDVGTVTVNDLIAPTADPRLPFGGRGDSGFGVTRGPEGLLAMTTPHTVVSRRGRWRPHLSPRTDSTADLLLGMLRYRNAPSWRKRSAAMRRIVTLAREHPPK